MELGNVLVSKLGRVKEGLDTFRNGYFEYPSVFVFAVLHLRVSLENKFDMAEAFAEEILDTHPNEIFWRPTILFDTAKTNESLGQLAHAISKMEDAL